MASAADLKTKGNEYFKKGEYKDALAQYRLALQAADVTSDIKLAALKNSAACNLKLASMVTRLLHANAADQFSAILLSGNIRAIKALVRIFAKGIEAVSESADVTAAMSETTTALLTHVIAIIKNRKVGLDGRAAAVNAIMTNAKRADIAKRFMTLGGVRALLILAALSPSPLQHAQAAAAAAEGKKQVTKGDKKEGDKGKDDTAGAGDANDGALGLRGAISVTLQRIHDATKAKGLPDEQFVADCLNQVKFVDDPQANLPATNVLITIMAAVVDVGNQILEHEDVFAHLMKMAQSSDMEVQCAAAEAIAHAASDKKRARGIMMEGFPILKTLYAKELPDVIRVRALCGLCKMASVGSGAKNLRSMSEHSMINLAKKLRPFLLESSHDDDVRKWASEGLAYLSLDADVKELISNDDAVLKAVHRVCVGQDTTIQFSLANMLVNLTNSFDKPEASEEQEQLKKLGKFAGENIPEPHEKDADEFVQKRVDRLVEHGFVTALVQLSKTQSEGTREQVARVLLALTEKQQHRGTVVAQGGARVLLELARENTDKGMIKAAHALAKIAITTDPTIAFPGQRVAELVKPLVKLSRERNGLMMFEAAMAMTNLASINDDLRNKLLRDKAVARLEDMMFDEDPLIRRAATEGLCNCFYSEKIFDQFAKKDGASFERLKLWILFAGVEQDDFDLPTCRAASGGLAILSSSPDVCQRIVDEKQGMQVLKELMVCGEAELQHRGLHIARNMVATSKEIAQHFTEQEMLVIITALEVTSTNVTIKQYTLNILEQLAKYGLVESVEAVRKSAVGAAAEIQAMRQRWQEEAKARQEEEEEEEELSDADDDGDDKEEEEVEEIEADTTKKMEKTKKKGDKKADDVEEAPQYVAPARPDDDTGPKVEILEE
ncbi:hypothetical protein PTSG_06979 [Salpingoeca rosetta]|uniref:UNC-45/Cro1/She4 central domain-containing protein n=1 Tax=Salpingoeca rosetta (strain ATCC 50818 / BSB-021) TaxID=946362 RepID=F2UFC9_SALR5|nr:uncharacterized protein PTSG_06979 [Salpingoeca rosetta]EGD75329.1 hypothetical protein PTSG_06979 [Salpingoeca rosetta]|eukprot:XP_004992382.1 hypothetical protein PTSG_06979 [Salpingoeca rosetta]